MDKILTRLENFFAGLRLTPLAPDGANEPSTDAARSCAVAQNKTGGFSIYIGASVRIGNYATRADACRVAEKWNFFVVEKQL